MERYQLIHALPATIAGAWRQNTNDQTVTSYNSGKN